MLFEKIRGLVAAPHTPFTPDGDVDLTAIESQIALLSRQGLAGVFVNGTTGEGLSLTTTERQQIVALWMSHAPKDLKVIVHVGHHSAREAATLAAHAQQSGAYGVSTMAPSFLKPGSVSELATFCAEIASAAPSLAFYYYHIPSLSGVSLSMPAFLEAAEPKIPNLVGIKYTHGDLYEFGRCLALQERRFDILWGVDEALLGALACGAQGAVGSTYNYAAPVYHEMMAAFAQGDLATARTCAGQSIAIVEQLMQYGGIAAGKAIMSLLGLECGPPRTPVSRLSETQRLSLLDQVRSLGCVRTHR